MSDSSITTHLQPAIGLRSGNRALSVMDQIREAILGGSIGAGERLNEVRLSKTLAVSRTPVRAALQALAKMKPADFVLTSRWPARSRIPFNPLPSGRCFGASRISPWLIAGQML